MSKDLFAAFGDFGEEDSTAAWSDQPSSQDFASYAQGNGGYNADSIWTPQKAVSSVSPQNENDDDFGDFEDAEPVHADTASHRNVITGQTPNATVLTTAVEKELNSGARASNDPKDARRNLPEQRQTVGNHPFAGRMDFLFETGDDEYDAGQDELGDLSSNPEAAMAYSKRIIAEQEAAMTRSRNEPQQSKSRSSPLPVSRSKPESKVTKQAPAKDPNVLFDADDVSEEDEDDDFDDFENAEEAISAPEQHVGAAQPRSPSTGPAIDLLGLDDAHDHVPSMYANGRTTDNSNVATHVSINNSSLMTRVQPDDEQWDDFETAETAATTKDPRFSNELPAIATSPKPQDSRKETSFKEPQKLPPTNVPPPAVILSLFPSIFADADQAIFNALGKLDVRQKQMLLAHPAGHQFLKGYLGHCIALGHVIAGRKLRWKRDQHLSQSMRIGPAAAGGKGGMKLTGVDKSEAAKEDREVVDVLRLWKGQLGKLRTAVAAASSAPALSKLPHVPEIAEHMFVKALKPVEGGITATHPCALCGLRREERVAKVDYEVEDSFGDWWIQGMGMHLSCRNFWDEFERKLKSR